MREEEAPAGPPLTAAHQRTPVIPLQGIAAIGSEAHAPAVGIADVDPQEEVEEDEEGFGDDD